MTPDSPDIRQLYMEKLTGTLSEADEQLLQHRLKHDPAAKTLWDNLEAENKALHANDYLQKLNAEAELAKVRSQLKTGTVKSFPGWRSIAAAVAILIISSFLLYRYMPVFKKTPPVAASENPDKKEIQLVLGNGQTFALKNKAENTTGELAKETSQAGQKADQVNTLIVPAEKDYKITLSDGTKVWLNAASKLNFPFAFGDTSREVSLDGEAYFEVTKDKDRPFIVHTPHTAVQVLGTKFNVNTYKDQETTSLVEGKVRLSATDAHTLELEPGYQGNFDPAQGFKKTPFRTDKVLSWMNGVYYFHNRPLAEVTDVIQRWFGIKVILDRAELATYPISGLLEKGQLKAFLNDLKSTARIDYSLSEQELHLK